MLAVTLPFLNEIVALFAASVAVAYVCHRVRLVPIAGFLIAGVLIGPNALGLIRDQALVDILAEVGVILLLFTIGVEFSLEKLGRIRRAIFVGGGVQVGLTVAAVAGGLAAFGVGWAVGIYTGFLVALSSTVIVLGLLASQQRQDAPEGRLALAFLIFQDLAVVGMVLLVPILAGEASTPAALAGVLGRAAALVVGVLVLARRVVPWVMEHVARTRQAELLLLTTVAVCFGTAALAALAGVSLALGAFLAGLVVSESRYSEQALSDVLPLRTLFNVVFFVSVGMLLDLRFVLAEPLVVAAAALGAVVLKTVTGTVAALVLRVPVRVAGAVGLGLAQVGEFSFVLERSGRAAGLSPAGLGESGGQVFIAATVLLMLATPAMLAAGPAFGRLVARTPLRRWGGPPAPEEPSDVLEDHTVVVGYGGTGERVVEVLTQTGVPVEVVEMNPEAVRRLDAAGVRALYGDATQAHILEAAGVERAKLLVVVVNDEDAARRVVRLARGLNPTLQIFARARSVRSIEPLRAAGADVVVAEEMETSVRLAAQVLGAYLVPPAEVDRLVREVRAEDYGVARGSIQEAHLMVLQGLDEDGLHTRAVAVRPGAPVAGRTLEASALRRDFALTVLAVRRGTRTTASPAGSFRVEPGDRLILVGLAAQFAACAHLFRTPDDAAPLAEPTAEPTDDGRGPAGGVSSGVPPVSSAPLRSPR